MTVLEVIKRSTEFLEKKGVDSPRLQTELLLAHLLRLPRMQLYLNFERILSESEVGNFRELIKRRSQREPLQHIIGTTSFCGLEIAVNRHALIPRPETELLAENGWKFLEKLAAVSSGEPRVGERDGPPHPSPPDEPLTPHPLPIGWEKGGALQTPVHGFKEGQKLSGKSPSALDLGTGTGCLVIALAVHCPVAQLVATDISAEALELARQNAARHNVLERIDFRQGDAFGAFEAPKPFDLIISNPPYIPTGEIPMLQVEVREHDPHLALDGGPDGLNFYRRIAREAGPFLKSGGKIMLEFGDGQAPAIREIFEAQKWIVEAILEDYTQRPRILIAHG